MSSIDELLLIPGPTNVSSDVLKLMGQPQMGHSSPEFIKAFSELLHLTKSVFLAERCKPYILTGSGTAAMEASVASLVEPGESLLVLDTGEFGQRFASIAECHGIKAHLLSFPFGKHADVKLVGEELSKGKYKAVTITHVDTSTTVENSVKEIVTEAHRHGVMSIVDAVCALGGCELRVDDWEVDIALAASQKAVGAPPGVSLIAVSERAMKIIEERKSPIGSYYLNLQRWRAVMDNTSQYLATPSVQLFLALKRALEIVLNEGLEARWKRHRIIAQAFRAGVESFGFDFVAEEGHRSATVTGIYVPDAKAGVLQETMRKKHGVQVARGLYENRDKMLRIAHFGNINSTAILSALAALELSSKANGVRVKSDVAVAAAMNRLEGV